ncbi:alpha-amylase [Balnearium lithotrophicum]|uniref:Alpha-amylase n=1 Tax=Balnearium lithotrophicum TaxID=223788 RepID=A0A521BQP2_9BACT|nr:alpha-amylase/4-alpha-glucanotransferase domain-containing protein [Balnearium lithotrophicum]SMO48870.1 alpha-amylase [Balnearium lithotrophicum]
MARLVFGIHNHQPVDNFKSIVEEAVTKSYRPFIERVYPFKSFKFSVHFSGWLLEYISKNHGDLIELLQSMVKEGRVEFFTGGYYEPILVSIPSRWRKYQIEKLNGLLGELFEVVPKGLWLTERVWDDSVICDIVECGVDYVVVDDYHFICSGFDRKQLGGYFLTESEGRILKVFPIDRELRYLIPFKPVERAVEYLKSNWGTRVLFDDGEKFGVWPGTYNWVYKSGWLESFLGKVENGEIETFLFSEVVSSEKPLGIAYLPTTSYYEMGEWALPPKRFKELKEAEEILKRSGIEGYVEKFLRGSIWKNFFVKYPESNYMHKRMLNLSFEEGSEEFKENLSKSQCNDVFWHGIFGGIYLPNLRDNFWRFLLSAQREVNRIRTYLEDLNLDGYEEGVLSSGEIFAVVSPKDGGALFELSLLNEEFNYQNVISRHREGYHYLLERRTEEKSEGILTIHERIPNLTEEERRRLSFDWHLRGSFISHFTTHLSFEEFKRETFREVSDFVNQPFETVLSDGGIILFRRGGVYLGRKFSSELRKTYKLKGRKLLFSERFKTEYPEEIFHILEFNFHFLNPEGFELQKVENSLEILDKGLSKRVLISASLPFEILHYPVETVSQSEKGVDFTVQGHCFGFCFKVKRTFSLEVNLEVKDV